MDPSTMVITWALHRVDPSIAASNRPMGRVARLIQNMRVELLVCETQLVLLSLLRLAAGSCWWAAQCLGLEYSR